MRCAGYSRWLLSFVLLGLGSAQLRADSDSTSADEQLLKAVGLTCDGPALLSFFQQRTQVGVESDKVLALIKQLGQGAPETRDKAAGELVALGPAAVPWLRQAIKDPDEAETMTRARSCLEAIDNPAIAAAAARVVSQRKPRKATEALLAYLPFADDASVVDEVQNSLSIVGFRDGKPDPALLAALSDPVPVRRLTAALAICQAGIGPWIAPVRKLLQDAKANVRLRVALALAALRQADALPVLIALLGELPPSQGRLAEDYLITLAGDQAPPLSLGDNEASREKCRKAWAAWWDSSADVQSLLDCFRKRTLSDSERDKIGALIRRLGDNAFEVREKASTDLLAIGSAAVSQLRQALKSGDVEIAKRAEECLQNLAKSATSGSPLLTARLIAFRKPGGAVEVLLSYLPCAEDDSVAEAVQETLDAVAAPEGILDPALVKALEDRSAVKRAAVVQAVCRAGAGEFASARKLLRDSDAEVRLRAAQSLAALQDHEAVVELIALLGELPPILGGQAEETLLRIAGDTAPAPEAGQDEAARRKRQAAWAAWWKANETIADLSRLRGGPRMLGYTLVVQTDFNNVTGRVGELGPNGKPRWEIPNLRFPVDAQVLPGNRVLIAEQQGQQVSERDFKGNVLWRHQVSMPICCQRLVNGNTFIATRNGLVELDRNDKPVFTYQRPGHDLMSAYKLRDGQIVLQTNAGLCLRLDATGREVGSFMAGQGMFGGMEMLTNGRILVAQFFNNRLAEYNAERKLLWEAAFASPNSACRLPNGHTLVASQNNQRVFEIDRGGKVVAELRTEARPVRVRRR
jgi:HEAT repeat protein